MKIETSCTDCGRTTIEQEEEILLARSKMARLCPECKGDRYLGLDSLLPPLLGNYCVNVELQWAINEKDLEYRAIGDMEEDFARRSLQSIRTALETVAGCGHENTPIGHYSIDIASLRRCMGQPIAERPGGHLKQYHEALNGLMSAFHGWHQSGLSPAEVDKVLKTACTALAIGTRKGWNVDPRWVQDVVAEESDDVPMSEEEARSRFGL